MGQFYVQARNRGGGLGKMISCFNPIVIQDLDFAFDPDNGIGFDRENLSFIHGGEIKLGMVPTQGLDFEFDGYPGGLSFHKFPGMSEMSAVAGMIDELPGEKITSDDLASWRQERTVETEMCQCCEESAERRANDPSRHPLYTILYRARTLQTDLEFRLSAPHVDLTASFAPHRITIRHGYLILTDVYSRQGFHVDMRMLHTISLDRIRLDGVYYSAMCLYDSVGTLNFRILAEGVSHASIWKDLCEASRDGSVS